MRIALRSYRVFALAVLIASDGAIARGECNDLDLDGFLAGQTCIAPEDCNDQDPRVFPSAPEVCNGIDDDCDGLLDESCVRACVGFSKLRERPLAQSASIPRIYRAANSWAVTLRDDLYSGSEESYDTLRIDFSGAPLALRSVVATGVYTGYTRLGWTGQSVIAGFARREESGLPGCYVRDVGRWGGSGNEEVELSHGSAGLADLAWSTNAMHALNVAYGATDSDFRMSKLSSNPLVLSQTASLVQQPRADLMGSSRLSWSGSSFGWVYDRNTADVGGRKEVYFRSVDASGSAAGPERRITDHRGLGTSTGWHPAIASKGPGQGFGVAWTDNRTGKYQVWMALIDAAGNIETTPGTFQVSNAVAHDVVWYVSISWNGEEFLVVWLNTDQTLTQFGKVMGTRVSATGAVLETRAISAGPNDTFTQDGPWVAWNGKTYGVVYERFDSQAGRVDVMYAEVGCNCMADADSDGRTACSGDCDESDAQVSGNKLEICSDAKDNDCDGRPDCSDSDCTQSGLKPPETMQVRLLLDERTVTWAVDPLAFSYDVVRGSLVDLQGQKSTIWATCVGSKLLTNTLDDGTVPVPGDGFYYLVRGRRAGCLVGTWGSPGLDSSILSCP